ncbi:hypothetical protein [Streptomyces sp. NPDC017529]|uniref:hypothetical protein n=1 Tax=Streptomyces sp. NPDC017529 TaxID=3365000 RepID=UPI0037ADC3BA
MTTPTAAGAKVAPDRTSCSKQLKILPRETAYVQETPGMSLFWEEVSIEPGHPPERCPRGRDAHFGVCYAEMITEEVRSMLECGLEPGHEDAHAAEIGFSDDGVCDMDMWMFWRAGVPGAREIRQPGTCDWEAGERGINLCVLFRGHGGRHKAQGLGFVDDQGLNRFGERPSDDTYAACGR